MRGAYQQVAQLIHQTSDLTVQSDSYPVSRRRTFLASSFFFLQMVLIAFILLSERVCALLGVAEPEAVKQKMYSIVLVWLTGNLIYGGMMQSGAFEVYKGNTLVWSKLHYHRMPTLQDLVGAFEAAGVRLRV